ncbi:MAG: hypothetical protein LUH23_09105 [Oscillospiraceae bacterium]|nr:hypothetical protein [Oscillospiraceae bacterium]
MNKIRYDDWALTIFLKIVATVAFLWSGFFWSGVTILNFYMFNTDESYRATGFLVASIFLLISLVLMFLRMYIIQFPFCVVGSVVYLIQAGELIDAIESYTMRYIPEIAILIVSLILFILHMARVISRSMGEKETFNTSPAESIIGEGITVNYHKEEKPAKAKKEKKSRKEKKSQPKPEYSLDQENKIDE